MKPGTTRLCGCLRVLDDLPPRSGALNMALDETLLAGLDDTPLLRIYRWDQPAVSFGYFEPWKAVVASHPDQPLVRRWTGGGVVQHGQDVTYSLLLPRSHPLTNLPAGESYRLIHLAVAETLPAAGWHLPELSASTSKGAAGPWRDCFTQPVQHDLLQAGKKIGGAAQRRTRRGLLHQGSVRLPFQNVPAATKMFVAKFPAVLAEQTAARALCPEEMAQAGRLAAAKYAADDWLQRR